MVVLTLASPAQTRRFARVLAWLLQPPALVTIEGDLGTGKTTLVREIMRARGVRGAAAQPIQVEVMQGLPLAAGSEALPVADVRLELLHRTLRSRLARLHACG